jgi:hypothetical protein
MLTTGILIAGISGCQFAYPFEIRGIVLAADGKPVSGVKVTFNAKHVWQSSFPVSTGADGKFVAVVRIQDIAFDPVDLPKWSLVFTKEGFTSTTIDIGPKEKPKSARETTSIFTEVTIAAR